MDIKLEFEIKKEELDFDPSQEYTESFPYNEASIALPESVKSEELDHKILIKSELEELEKESVLSENHVNIDVMKSENLSFFETSSSQQVKKFMTLKNVSSLLGKIRSKHSEVQFESDQEKFLSRLVVSKFPLVFLHKLSEKELKILMDDHGKHGEKSSLQNKSQTSRIPNTEIGNEQSKIFSCSFCDFTFQLKSELKNHLKSHKEIKFKCSYCNYESNRRSSLKVHLLKHLSAKLYKCSDCNYECNWKKNLKSHMLTHQNIKEKLFRCSDCIFECNYKNSLKRHMLTHRCVKLFKCSDCDYECNQKESLVTHMLTHQNTKRFKCSDCNYECNQKSSLKTHMLSHQNIKLFKCSDCNYECNVKESLKTHMLSHRNIKLFKCSECNFECNYRGSLKRHMQRFKHSRDPPALN